MRPLYFDHNATTPIAPRVFAAMRPFLEEHFGNPGSAHVWGLGARQAVDAAREKTAALSGPAPGDRVHGMRTESINTCSSGISDRMDIGRLGRGDPSVLVPARAWPPRAWG
jgi:cysteine desulfurase